MESLICYTSSHPFHCSRFSHGVTFASRSRTKKHNHKKLQLPKNLRHRRHTEAPPDFHPPIHRVEDPDGCDEIDGSDSYDGNISWEPDEIEAISSLFQGRVPQKPGNLDRQRPLPLPLPHKIRPLGVPTPKKLIRTHVAVSRQPVSNQIYKNPSFLIGLAREIKSLPPDDNVSTVLNQWSRLLRKGSLSLTVRELGHMGLPGRALHVLCWAQNQPHLFPDDRTLASTVEVMARAHELKMPFELDKFLSLASQSVYEAVVRGFVRGGNTRLACRLLSAAKKSKRVLSPSVYAKVILELGKCPDKRMLALPLLEELARREDLVLSQQDCTAIMKVCTRLGKFDVVEALYDWVKESGRIPGVVMYTALIHSRFVEGRYRDAMAVVWEMEASNCPIDLPAYRVLMRLFVASNDLSRAGRYFAKLKECGFAPTYDIYRGVIGIFMASGRLAKCKEICREAEMAGFKIEMERMM
ncbi:pentatricopeptide repeat-containing protein At2g01860 [Salvia miltiorrhiza]|uniref:pentatricopeptide repeat-containing protein At2g01860 n=1 Tax=Salvia miltiorrhiza TaxID=226208 RepID=UPI0025AB8115|nr:pentatricopeptide repeat-containing protein At2g01860 [Salvia miltiorrhiza]